MRRRSETRGPDARATTRCAIYTRKSSDEGLEQAFNSLDAQRETCEAYIASQKHEGWTALAQLYDDGGVSGGTMERPALRRLLDDIKNGYVDTVVVYKVDRLTRSLADFAKIVDIFEASGVTFISVTQSFNTTTSMGRLTLNMLLSFAQFEREVAGERIRDKIAASKRKGMWMGGHPPLGYDVIDRKLVINEHGADVVRHIFEQYLALSSVRSLQIYLGDAGIVSKQRTDRHGRPFGGKHFERGALYAMLQNRIYRGEITHREECYPGQHDALVDEGLWDEVQEMLAAHRVDRSVSAHAAEPSLLAGMIHDEQGERLTPSHANKKGTRYRYYVSQNLILKRREENPNAGMRVPAGDLEQLVTTSIRDLLSGPATLHELLQPLIEEAPLRQALVRGASQLAEAWLRLPASTKRGHLQQFIHRIDVGRDNLAINICVGSLVALLADREQFNCPALPPRHHLITVPAELRRAGKGMRLVINGSKDQIPSTPDHSLLRLLGQAHRYQIMVFKGEGASIAELAKAAKVDPSYFTRILKISFLSPQITAMILDGRQPASLNARRLTQMAGQLSTDWADQARQLSLA